MACQCCEKCFFFLAGLSVQFRRLVSLYARCKQMQRLSTRNRPHTYRPTSRIDPLQPKASTASKASTFSSRLARPLFSKSGNSKFLPPRQCLDRQWSPWRVSPPRPSRQSPKLAPSGSRQPRQPLLSKSGLTFIAAYIHHRLLPLLCSGHLYPPERVQADRIQSTFSSSLPLIRIVRSRYHSQDGYHPGRPADLANHQPQ